MTNTVHISKLNGKLEGFRAIGTNTATNKFCQKMYKAPDNVICSKCYSMKSVTGYRKNMQPALQRNSDLLASRVLTQRELPVINDLYFRFSHHGELINELHLINITLICNYNVKTHFTLWTKRKDLVRKVFKMVDRPANLRLIYSNPKIDAVLSKPPVGFDATFNNVSKSYDGPANCTGQKCRDCLMCYDPAKFSDTIVEHVK